MKNSRLYDKEELNLDCDWICSNETDHVQAKELIKFIMDKAKQMTQEEIDELFKEVEEDDD